MSIEILYDEFRSELLRSDRQLINHLESDIRDTLWKIFDIHKISWLDVSLADNVEIIIKNEKELIKRFSPKTCEYLNIDVSAFSSPTIRQYFIKKVVDILKIPKCLSARDNFDFEMQIFAIAFCVLKNLPNVNEEKVLLSRKALHDTVKTFTFLCEPFKTFSDNCMRLGKRI